jgi:hypothetical protein
MKLGLSRICLIALPLLLFGCAPTGRLTFPSQPFSKNGGYSWYDVRHTGHPEFATLANADGVIDTLCYDDDGDGRPDRIYHLSDYSNQSVPHLIVLLDSIPFQAVADRYAAGEFRFFPPPQKVIPPFPSLTEVCYTELMHAPPLPAMIDQYYDPAAGDMRNGIWSRINGYEEPWERRLEYHARFWEGGLAYLRPRPWYAGEMERVRRALDDSPHRVTLVYVTSASGMLCRYGQSGLDQVLEQAQQLCLQLLYERRGAIKITLMADHGHNLVASRNVRLDQVLKRAELHPGSRLIDSMDVVVEMNGLVTYAGVFTSQPGRVVDVLLKRPEIAWCVYMEGDRVMVRDADGAALIECRLGMLRYAPVTHDVLGYGPVIERLKSDGKMSAEGFASDDDWFHATLDHLYPDGPRRLWNSLHGQVVHPPQVLMTLRDGYCAGQPSLERFITMASTHGSLNQANSATFVMSMTGRIRGPLRTRDVLEQLEPRYVVPVR